MRETKAYSKDKNGIQEFIRMKPYTDIKGEIKIQLINNDTKEIEQEVFVENVRMKWLDTQVYTDGLLSSTCLYNLLSKYAGYSTSYGYTASYGGYFKSIALFNSEQDIENEKISSVNGNVLGYCGFDETYSGNDKKKGSFNSVESYVKQNSEGNLVMHNVYEFSSYAANGTTTHIGFCKNPTETMSYKNYVCYGTNFNCFKGMPSKLIPEYSPVVDGCSWNCYNTGKNTFLFVLKISSVHYVCELNIVSGECLRKVKLTGVDGVDLNYRLKFAGIQISKDGSSIYALIYVNSTSVQSIIGATKNGWNLVTFDTQTGQLINNVEFGNIAIGSTGESFCEYSVACIDESNGNIIIFGNASGNSLNYIQRVNSNDGTPISTVDVFNGNYNDSDCVDYNNVYRGSLIINKNNEIVYRRNSYYYTDKNHLVFDTKLNLIRRYSHNKDRININMHIIGNENLCIGTSSSSTSDFTYWGIFDKTNRYQVNTLTKLPTPVVKTSNFTMKVQYDMVFEMPNILDAFIERQV